MPHSCLWCWCADAIRGTQAEGRRRARRRRRTAQGPTAPSPPLHPQGQGARALLTALSSLRVW
eukprot:2768663-Rhodomonas_salina.1